MAYTESKVIIFSFGPRARADPWSKPIRYVDAALKAAGLLNWSFYSNFYDIVYVIARKR
jgi:hypothetical protein